MFQLPSFNYPFRIKHQSEKPYIFDKLRKKWMLLTPEEWVRQNLIVYFIHQAKMPAACISIEKTIKVNHLKRRYDIVVYRLDKPWLLVECKEPNTALDKNIWMQVGQYNQILEADYCMISNGHQHLVWDIAHAKFLDAMPIY